MRIRPNTARNNDNYPGPGNYDVRTDKSLQVPSYKFGHEKKDGLDLGTNKFSPGPGTYEYGADAIKNARPKFSFGKELRGAQSGNRAQTPGPGNYEYKQYVGKEAPKITMSAKTGGQYQSSALSNPGPGQYNQTNANVYRAKSPSYKIGTSCRTGKDYFKDNPGPGK
ncbi:MAG: hypothetical protein MJ252_15495 [archaeon]|nr:hypothetical protein [archaeon]